MQCSKCGETRVDKFYNSTHSICKPCRNKQVKDWREENPQNQKEYNRRYQKKYALTPIGRYWRLRTNARMAGRDFNIKSADFIDWFESQDKICYYCKCAVLENSNNRKHELTHITIDRKGNDRGYTLDNIVIACRKCNLVKGSWFTEIQMLEIAHKYFAP